MKVTAFSDTHGLHRKVSLPASDILLFGGDAMTCGYKDHELYDFLDWYDSQEAQHKIMIAGNHDRFIENYRGLFLDMLKEFPSVKYLENDGVVVDGLTIWGSPDSKKFCNWAFNKSELDLDKSFCKIPIDVDILLTHAPAYGCLDQLERGENVGEIALSRQFNRLAQIRHHIFGHIHCGYGKLNLDTHTAWNVSLVNEQYQLQNQPISFKIYPHG